LLIELFIELALKLMGQFIFDLRLLLDELLLVFFLQIGSDALFELSLGLGILLFFLLGVEFGFILRVHFSQMLDLFIILSLLLFKEILSLLNREMGILWGKSKVNMEAQKLNKRMEIANIEREKAEKLKADMDHIEKDAERAAVEKVPFASHA
jgi:hypothetical protein